MSELGHFAVSFALALICHRVTGTLRLVLLLFACVRFVVVVCLQGHKTRFIDVRLGHCLCVRAWQSFKDTETKQAMVKKAGGSRAVASRLVAIGAASVDDAAFVERACNDTDKPRGGWQFGCCALPIDILKKLKPWEPYWAHVRGVDQFRDQDLDLWGFHDLDHHVGRTKDWLQAL